MHGILRIGHSRGYGRRARHIPRRTSGRCGCGSCRESRAGHRGVFASTPTPLSCGRRGRVSSGSPSHWPRGRCRMLRKAGGGGPASCLLPRTSYSDSRRVPVLRPAAASSLGRDNCHIRPSTLSYWDRRCNPTLAARWCGMSGCRSCADSHAPASVPAWSRRCRIGRRCAPCTAHGWHREGHAADAMPARIPSSNKRWRGERYGWPFVPLASRSWSMADAAAVRARHRGKSSHSTFAWDACSVAGNRAHSARISSCCHYNPKGVYDVRVT